MTAMHYGVWLPQKWLRDTVGASLLPGANFEGIMARVGAAAASGLEGWGGEGGPVVKVAGCSRLLPAAPGCCRRCRCLVGA